MQVVTRVYDSSWRVHSFQNLEISEQRRRLHQVQDHHVHFGEPLISVLQLVCANSLEECIAQNDIIQSVHPRIITDITINEEEDWKIDFFTRSNLLLFKAKALDFGKVRCDLADQYSL